MWQIFPTLVQNSHFCTVFCKPRCGSQTHLENASLCEFERHRKSNRTHEASTTTPGVAQPMLQKPNVYGLWTLGKRTTSRICENIGSAPSIMIGQRSYGGLLYAPNQSPLWKRWLQKMNPGCEGNGPPSASGCLPSTRCKHVKGKTPHFPCSPDMPPVLML